MQDFVSWKNARKNHKTQPISIGAVFHNPKFIMTVIWPQIMWLGEAFANKNNFCISFDILYIPKIYDWGEVSQTSIPSVNHEEENNCRFMDEFKVLHQHLLDYNKKTFDESMQDVNEGYKKRINTNKNCEVSKCKKQKNYRIHETKFYSGAYPNLT